MGGDTGGGTLLSSLSLVLSVCRARPPVGLRVSPSMQEGAEGPGRSSRVERASGCTEHSQESVARVSLPFFQEIVYLLPVSPQIGGWPPRLFSFGSGTRLPKSSLSAHQPSERRITFQRQNQDPTASRSIT